MTDKQPFIRRWLIAGSAAAVIAAGLLYLSGPVAKGDTEQTTKTTPTTAQAGSGTPSTPQPFDGQQPQTLGTSADHVRVSALRRGDRLYVNLRIDSGWHVNAHPASLDFLIPTELSVLSAGTPVPVTVNYPEGHNIDLGLAKPITVYSETVRITASLPEDRTAVPLTAAVRIQACSTRGRCLRPSTVTVPVVSASGT